jgi:hypothetical protein
VFIKLGPKHASNEEIELVVFEVFGEFRLGVRGLGLLLAVLGSKLRLGVSVRNVVPTLSSSKRQGLSLNGRC